MESLNRNGVTSADLIDKETRQEVVTVAEEMIKEATVVDKINNHVVQSAQ